MLDTENANVTRRPRIEFYKDMMESRSPTELIDRAHAAIRAIGFTDYSMGYTTLFPKHYAPTCTTMPEELTSCYRRERLYRYDLAVAHAAYCEDPVFLLDAVTHAVHSPLKTQVYASFVKLAMLYNHNGYSDLYYFSLPAPVERDEGRRLLFTVGAKNLSDEPFRARVADNCSVLHLLAEALDYVGTKKFPNYFQARGTETTNIRTFGLTPKPLRLLRMIATKNVTLREAAERLHISLDTANKHIAAAKKALGAKTTAAAVFIGLVEGFITEED